MARAQPDFKIFYRLFFCPPTLSVTGKKNHRNETYARLFHPVPSYQFHALAVPIKRKSSFLEIDLSAIGDPEYLLDLLAVCQQIARDQGLNRYSIIVNGGDYQDVPQVHFHIAANDDDAHREESTNLIEENGDSPLDEPLHLFKPHSTRWAYHQIVQHERLVSGFRDLLIEVEQTQDCLIELFEGAQKLLSIKPLAAFSVILYVQPDQNKRVQLEIVSNMVA